MILPDHSTLNYFVLRLNFSSFPSVYYSVAIDNVDFRIDLRYSAFFSHIHVYIQITFSQFYPERYSGTMDIQFSSSIIHQDDSYVLFFSFDSVQIA